MKSTTAHAAFAALSAVSLSAIAGNPLVKGVFTPDPAPFVHGDKVYMFTGHDENDGEMRDMTVPNEVEDAKRVVAWAASRPWCNGKVSLVGHSQGGVVAAMLLGPKGGHGYGSRRTGRDNDAWPELAAVWLRRTLEVK